MLPDHLSIRSKPFHADVVHPRPPVDRTLRVGFADDEKGTFDGPFPHPSRKLTERDALREGRTLLFSENSKPGVGLDHHHWFL